jgi:hypothetical protein
MIFVVAVPYPYVTVHRATCNLAVCSTPQPDQNESPAEPDHDYVEGSLWVQTVTGGRNEFSPVLQVSFLTPQLTPFRKLEFKPNFAHRGRAQTRALGQMRRSASMKRGR